MGAPSHFPDLSLVSTVSDVGTVAYVAQRNRDADRLAPERSDVAPTISASQFVGCQPSERVLSKATCVAAPDQGLAGVAARTRLPLPREAFGPVVSGLLNGSRLTDHYAKAPYHPDRRTY
jgi:hypothetical protein